MVCPSESWLVVQYRAGRLTATAEPSGDPTAAGRVEVKLESAPAGAAVYDSADGRELGQTPLILRLAPGEARKVELRLAGHEHRSLVLRAGAAMQVIELKAEVKQPPR